MLQVQQESIDNLKAMITQLLQTESRARRVPSLILPLARVKENRSREKILLLKKLRVRITLILNLPNLQLKRRMV